VGEEQIEHLTARAGTSFGEHVFEIAKMQELFGKRERAIRDAPLDPFELLSRSLEVRFGCRLEWGRPSHCF
jgi:hypothetical protein